MAAALLAPTAAGAGVIRLENGNSYAEFRDVPDDGDNAGLYDWVVDGVDHLYRQWFWFRVGDGVGESRLDELAHVSSVPSDTDGDGLDELLRVTYRDPAGQFSVRLLYVLTGGAPSTRRSDLVEVIHVQNLSPNQTLDFHLFQYSDFDLNQTRGDDSLVITGNPANTAHQTDPAMQVSETVVTPPPTHYEAGDVDDPASIARRLLDPAPTTLADTVGPLITLDAAWGFQWDFALPPGGSFLLSKDKNIRPGPNIPEPSAAALGLVAIALGAALGRRRARR